MPQERIETYRKAVEQDLGNIDARYQLGLAYYQARRVKEAIAELQRVIILDPKHADAHFQLSLWYYGRCMFDAAIEAS
ncbi:MAG: tetratricopeptide repeat protein, partial [Candidatus Methylomirabilaceae bacterium]